MVDQMPRIRKKDKLAKLAKLSTFFAKNSLIIIVVFCVSFGVSFGGY